MSDVKYALRQFAKHPGFALLAVLTLALGIGATTAMFSVVRGVMLTPLPYEQPERLVSLWTRYTPSSGQDIPRFPLSPPELIDYREQSRLMENVVPYGTRDRTLGGDGQPPERVRTTFVGAGMFQLLGVQAAIGRTFSPDEELPRAVPVLVLSHALWRDRFGADSSVVGRTVTFGGETAEIVGVMPEEFVFPTASSKLWSPFGLDEVAATNRFAHYLLGIGRLESGVTLEQAKQELDAITTAWNDEYDHHAMGHFIFLRAFHDDLVGDRGQALWLLMAAVALVLVIAVVNVANLLLSRAESRQAEIAVRSTLGAGRGRLLKQFVVESLVLAVAGAVLGVLLATWATPALLALHPQAIPRAEAVRVDWAVLGFALATGVVTAVLFGGAPALGRRTLTAITTGARATTGRAQARLRGTLIGAEATVGVLVILAAGLVTRSFVELTRVDPGVRSDGLLLFDLQLPDADYPPEAVPGNYAVLLERLRSLPGVENVGATSSLPVADIPVRQDLRIEGRPQPAPDQAFPSADLITVHPGYFEALGIPLLAGRRLEETDREGTQYVALINEAAARRHWPGEGPLGARFRYGTAGPLITIVGVVGDTRVEGLLGDDRPQVYLPHRQLQVAQGSTGRNLTIAVRAGRDPLQLARPVRAVVAEFDPRLPVANLRTMKDVLASAVAPQRFTASLLGGFAAMALLLAAIGVYGVTSYTVNRRTREIGIRVALGARSDDVLTRVMRESIRPVLIGAVLGLGVALIGAGVVSRFVFDVGVRDPLTFVGAPLVLMLVAALATYLPARRAAHIDPMEALRYE